MLAPQHYCRTGPYNGYLGDMNETRRLHAERDDTARPCPSFLTFGQALQRHQDVGVSLIATPRLLLVQTWRGGKGNLKVTDLLSQPIP